MFLTGLFTSRIYLEPFLDVFIDFGSYGTVCIDIETGRVIVLMGSI
jgi:hypothetical protein